jgi:UDP-glucose 4-epimerase
MNRVRAQRILVTGATGTVGPRVVQALRVAGYRVRTLSLYNTTRQQWPGDVETRIGDVTDLDAVHAAVQGVDAVVHMAALLHIVNPPQSLRTKYKHVNVDGTSMVMQEALREGVRRVLLFSTIAVYGASVGEILNEDSPTNPKSFYEQTKREAENIVLHALESDGRHIGTVLRIGAIYGSRIKGNYRQLLKALAKGRFIPIGHGRNRRTIIYDKDVARAAVLALQHPGAGGKIYNVSDGEFHTMSEIIGAICIALGRKAPCLSLPIRPVRFAAGIVEDAARLVGRKSPITRAMIDKYAEDIAVDSRRIQKELGFVPKFDLAAGWKETVQKMRRSGEL